MSEKKPLMVGTSGRRIVLSTIASYWADSDSVVIFTKSGHKLSLRTNSFKQRDKLLSKLDSHFSNILEDEDEE
jgi:hypothetical protein